MLKSLVVTVALAAAGLAQAQAPAAPSAPVSSAAKKELVAKLLQLLQPGVAGMAQQLAQQPAVQLQQAAAGAMQRVPPDRREALARDIDADLRKYVEEAVPIARDKAAKLAPTTIGPLLEERFTEDELRQVVAILESPANRKFQQQFPDMQRALGEKLVAESGPEIEVKLRALNQSVTQRLQAAAPPQPGASAPKPAPKPAAKPASKP
jgi:hypothetical protein